MRIWLNKDLWFSKIDRYENIRRATQYAYQLNKNNISVITSFISPYEDMRLTTKLYLNNYIEVFVNCPLYICEQRDPKWLYAKARNWKIINFTWISDIYEIPSSPNIILNTDVQSIDESVNIVLNYLLKNKYI